MNFKIKALVQNIISILPQEIAQNLYYFIQRKAGRLQSIDPTPYLRQAAQIKGFDKDLKKNSNFRSFEVGTGRTLNVPFALWLMGAKRIYTYDCNKYLKKELIMESIHYMIKNKKKVEKIFKNKNLPFLKKRFDTLLKCADPVSAIMRSNIHYVAPGDASSSKIKKGSIDLHTSVNTLEHIPKNQILKIFLEAHRLLSKKGLLIHIIDTSDHFSQTDKKIHSANFLRFSPSEWSSLAGNSFMYQNRMRPNEYIDLLQKSGKKKKKVKLVIDKTALKAIRKGFPLHKDFRRFSEKENASSMMMISAFKKRNN